MHTDHPDDVMRTGMRLMMGVFAQIDRMFTVKKLRNGGKARASTGKKPVGAYHYGTQGVGGGGDRDAGVHPEEAATVERSP